MNDTIIMENYLLVLKSNVEVFVHGTLESSFENTQNLLKKCLNTTIDSQRKTYVLMTNEKMYKVETVNLSAIKKCLKQLNKN